MKKDCFYADIRFENYERTFKYNNIDMLTLTIKYPVITMKNNKKSESIINNEIAMDVNDYIRYADYLYDNAVKFYFESQENNFPFHGFEAYMDYRIAYDANCVLSLYFDKYEFTGGAHGSTVRSSHTWDLCSGMHIYLDTIFQPNADYRLMLSRELFNQAEYNLNQNPGIYFDDYKSLLIKNFDPCSFYLTPVGLTIYYQQYEVAPYSTGIVEFTFPYSIVGWQPKCRK